MAAPTPPTPAAAPRSALPGLALGLLGVGLAVALAAAGAAAWLLRSDAGAAWLIGRLPASLRVIEPRGALLPDFAASRIEIDLAAPEGGTPGRITLDGVRWRALQFAPATGARWLRIRIDELAADRVEVRPAAGGPSAGAPSSLTLPIELEVLRLKVGQVAAPALGSEPLRDVTARLHLGADAGALHRLDEVRVGWRQMQAQGAARIASHAPFSVAGELLLEGTGAGGAGTLAGAAWQARTRVNGPLGELATRLELGVTAAPGRAPASLEARATLRPFAAWPIGELEAQTRALDLATLDAAWPTTALDARARVRSEAIDRPAQVDLELGNVRAGRWSDGALPLRQLRIDLRARPDDPSTLDVQAFDALLGSERAPAGALRGEGRWRRDGWALKATLDAIDPSRLDARAPAMRLAGPIEIEGQGLDAATLRATAKAELAGRFVAGGGRRDATLRLALRADPQAIEVTEAHARSGAARASARVKLQRPGGERRWRASGEAELAGFDPLPCWPGPDDPRWRRGTHRLNATAGFDLALPAAALDAAPRARLEALRGEARLTLRPSVLAGVPLAGEARLRAPGGGALEATVALETEGNRLRAEGRMQGDGRNDRWDLVLDAPALARVAPVARLLAPDAAPPAGSASASARLEGRWPELRSSGRFEAQALRAGTLRAERASGRWQVGTAGDGPLEARVELGQAAAGVASIEQGTLTLEGTMRAHRLALRAESKALPPAWTEDVQAATGRAPRRAATRSLLELAGDGGFIAGRGPAPVGWRGRVERLELRGDNGADWLRAADLAAQVRWAEGPASLSAEPGRLSLLGAAMRWERITWQAASAGGPARIDARAELEPIAIGPVLARLQPAFGWGGDLTVGGRLELRSAPRFSADVVIERARGDLTVTDETGTQALGLSDLRLGLVAADGTWSFTQAMAGSNVGVLGGAIVARTSPEATWPAPQTPVSGGVELRVANLGTWGTWVPAGWRLGGTLRMSATIGGTFGAPEYTGEIRGEGLSVRNFAEGVAVGDGDVAIALQGESARIERFTARAGDGTLKLEGGADFGAAPRAQLRLAAERFQLLGRVDRRIVASGNAELVLDRESAALQGTLGVDEGLIDFTRGDAPSLAGDVQVVRPKTAEQRAREAEEAERATPRTPARPVRVALDLRVGLGERLRVRGRGLDTGLRGELRLTSPNNRLAVNGTVRAEGGTYQAYGQKLEIDRGLLVFTGAAENPRLDIEATRPNIDVRAGVAITGFAIDPRVRLFSEPEMSELEKLSWIVLGRESDGLGSTETALLQRAALALLSGEGPGVTDQLFGAIGIDELSVRQSDGEVRQTVVSLGKQLSRRWYVGYERGLNETTGNWQLIYRVARRFTLRAQSGNDNALDAIFTWRWQ